MKDGCATVHASLKNPRRLAMRGIEDKRDAMFIYVSPEDFVPADHPLRPIRTMVDQALESLSVEFDRMYSHTGRPSIPPERLLKALILQV